MFEIIDLPDKAALAKLTTRYPMLDVPALETWLGLLRISGDCMNDLDQFLARHNLSQRKFFVLILLMRNPDGLKVSQLAEGTGVSCATMTGVVEGLLKAGLITRETDPQDRRAFVVAITTNGQDLLDQVLPQHYTRIKSITACLDPGEQKQLQTLLSKIAFGLHETRSRKL
ncbi:MAG: MarR family transcriptional regulator [Geobacteraceae bacterium]|nr:MarR family transcriptional regulator [Geobacteraceae bacterium]